MSTVQILPLAVYPANTYVISPTAIADGVTSITIGIQRDTSADTSIWSDPAALITYSIELSRDGGSTWAASSSGSAGGGIVKNKFNVEIPQSFIQVDIPLGTQRQLRGSIVTTASIKTSATLTVT